MALLTITSANSVYMLGVPGVFSAPQQLQQFAVDEAFDVEQAEITVTQIGVDGEGVAGWVPRPIVHTISLMATSPSNLLFEQWITALDGAREVIYATGTIALPSIQRKYSMQRGILTRYNEHANVRRTLQSRSFQITWLPGNGLPAFSRAPL